MVVQFTNLKIILSRPDILTPHAYFMLDLPSMWTPRYCAVLMHVKDDATMYDGEKKNASHIPEKLLDRLRKKF